MISSKIVTDSKPFYIKLDHVWWVKRNDILQASNHKLHVIKVYDYNWWRKFLLFLNKHYDLKIKVRICQLKVIKHDTN